MRQRFKSVVDVLNEMEALDWQLQHAYAVSRVETVDDDDDDNGEPRPAVEQRRAARQRSKLSNLLGTDVDKVDRLTASVGADPVRPISPPIGSAPASPRQQRLKLRSVVQHVYVFRRDRTDAQHTSLPPPPPVDSDDDEQQPLPTPM